MQQNKMGQNIIITEPSKNLRALGRNALTGKWKLGMLAVLIYTLCLVIPTAILNAIFGSGQYDLANLDLNEPGAYVFAYNAMTESAFLSDIYTILVTGALELGITLFFLALFRKQLVGVLDVFLGFEHFGKALGLLLFQALFIILWMFAFIVPGIIAAIRYSQAFFILADNPEKTIRQCMNESKMMMKGNKSKYFCLSLSFIGWMLLTALPVGILEGIAELMNIQTGAGYAIIFIIEALCWIPVEVYMYSTFAGFYEILAGHLIKETAPAPVMPEMVPGLEADKPEGDDDFFIPKEM